MSSTLQNQLDIMYTVTVLTFNDFLLQKLQEFERKKGKRVSQEEFADYLGVNRISISYWLSGRNKPSIENINLLADKLGPEIYDVLGLPRPDPFLSYVQRASVNLKDTQKRKIEEQIQKYIAANEKKSTT